MRNPQLSPNPQGLRIKQRNGTKHAPTASPNAGGNSVSRRSKPVSGDRPKHHGPQKPSSDVEQVDRQATHRALLTEGATLPGREVAPPTKRNVSQPQSYPTADASTRSSEATVLADDAMDGQLPQETPTKAHGAYAGPTFHASPAPSSLPMPKFFAKSAPITSPQIDLPTRLEESSNSTTSGSPSPPSPSRAPLPGVSKHSDSPLDIFFKADREEKARRSVTGPAPFPSASGGSLSPQAQRPHYHHRHQSQNSLTTMFPLELDGERQISTGTPPRYPSGASGPQTSGNGAAVQPSANESNAMKELLMSISQRKPDSAAPPRTVERIPSEPSSGYHTPSPFFDPRRAASGPSTPALPMNETSNSSFFYGNRNLSPLFKAAQGDTPKRNSGLRSEITPDLPSANPSALAKPDPKAISRQYLVNVLNPGERRYSASQFFPPGQSSGPYSPTAPIPVSYQTHLNERPNQTIPVMASPDTNYSKPISHASFQPKPDTKLPAHPQSLERDLKRLLNLNPVAHGNPANT